MSVLEQLAPVRQRLRVRTLLWAVAAAAVAGASVRTLGQELGRQLGPAWSSDVLPVIAAVFVAVLIGMRARAQWHWMQVADAVEVSHRECANCVRALVDVELKRIDVTPSAHARLGVAVRELMAGVRPSQVVPLRTPLAVMLCAVAGSLVIVGAAPAIDPPRVTPGAMAEATPLDVTVEMTPPIYLEDSARAMRGEGNVQVPEGSSLRLRVSTSWTAAWVEPALTGPGITLARAGDGMWLSAPFMLSSAQVLVVATGPAHGDLRESRVVSLQVTKDAAPQVSIATPGRDVVRVVGATDPLVVRLEAADDHRLAALELRYVRLTGGGETFTFTDGTVPLVRTEVSSRVWTADARWAVGGLALERGESLVYRGAVRDSRPGADWVMSDSYVIDIGTPLEASGAGADLPEEDRRYAISQQMVIVKTERLQTQRSTLSDEAHLEQAQMLAAEQRRVRAEVVFLSGGDIADEVEEAEHSHELQEGRLENVGRAEMVRAMAEMSRAESALTAGDLRAALRFERAALGALQRAFDRRRYFLRTPTERTRIDQSRRLSGDRRGAVGGTHSSERLAGPDHRASAAIDRAAEALRSPVVPTAALMAELVAVAPDDREWRLMVGEWAAADARAAEGGPRDALLQWLRMRQLQMLPPASAGLPTLAAGAGFANDARIRERR